MSSTDLDPKGVALSFLKRAARDTFKVCAESAEAMAAAIEAGDLSLDAPDALRLLASMFQGSARRE
jgi:hypothetical protein